MFHSNAVKFLVVHNGRTAGALTEMLFSMERVMLGPVGLVFAGFVGCNLESYPHWQVVTLDE
eukprot:5971708-Ditylum_brightwellii.AAC.1